MMMISDVKGRKGVVSDFDSDSLGVGREGEGMKLRRGRIGLGRKVRARG